jgi:hypothetical protein
VIERMEKMGDLFEAVLKLKQKLPQLPGMEKAAAPSASKAGLDIAARAEKTEAKRVKKSVKPVPKRSAAAKKRRKV